MVVERLECDFDVGHLHALVDFAGLLAADKLTVLVGKFELETDFVVETL